MNDDVWLELADRVRDPEFAVELVRVLRELSEAAEKVRDERES